MTRIPRILQGARVPLFGRLLANGFVQAGVMVLTAILIKQVFDDFMAPESVITATQLLLFSIGLIGAAMVLAALRLLERVDSERMGQHYIHEVRVGLFGHMSRLPARDFQRRSRGGVLLRFIGDLTALRQWVSLGVARLSVAAVTSIATLVALVFVNSTLAWVVGVALMCGVLTSLGLGHWLQRKVREARRRRANLAANVSEKISALAVIQAYGQSGRERSRMERQSGLLVDAMVDRARAVGTLRGLVELTAGIATAAAVLLGAVLVSQGQSTPGAVVAAMSIVGLLTPALRDLGRVQEYWHGAVVSREKISDFLGMRVLEQDECAGVELGDGSGHLVFDQVVVDEALKAFTVEARAGQLISVVGPNGAGKSTLLALAARMMDPQQGSVYLDGENVRNISLNSLREAVGIVTADLPLLRGSIERNLRYRMPKVEDEEVARVMQLCGINEFINNFPEGLKTRIREGGSNLSLGQRQRITMARALLGNPRLLLLDEVDANLDPQAGAALRRVLANYQGTVIMISHRLDWISMADSVWHVKDGRLLEVGPPDQLLKGDGPTAQLFRRPQLVVNGG